MDMINSDLAVEENDQKATKSVGVSPIDEDNTSKRGRYILLAPRLSF